MDLLQGEVLSAEERVSLLLDEHPVFQHLAKEQKAKIGAIQGLKHSLLSSLRKTRTYFVQLFAADIYK